MINPKCPKCGGTRVQLSNEESENGCLQFFLLGWLYIIWLIIKCIIGIIVFLLWDWWVAILDSSKGKGHIWECRKLFSGKKRVYFCHDCGHNFRA